MQNIYISYALSSLSAAAVGPVAESLYHTQEVMYLNEKDRDCGIKFLLLRVVVVAG